MKNPSRRILFRRTIYAHFYAQGRVFPWRETTNPYHILISEMMLQQTQADRVVPYYHNFLAHFPSVDALARAPLSEILILWQGLGYNRRAKYLWQSAQELQNTYGGFIPKERKALLTLPGVGPYTAAAVCVFAYNQAHVLLETNIRTALIHHFFPTQKNIPERALEESALYLLDRRKPRLWYTALMDYGAHIKMTVGNENRKSELYRKQSPFKGSGRELRGNIITQLTTGQPKTTKMLASRCMHPENEVKEKVKILAKEGMVNVSRGKVYLV